VNKNQCPCWSSSRKSLILGIGDTNDYFLASDVSAIVHHTQKVVYLDDNDVVVIKGSKYELLNMSNQQVQREVQEVEFDVESVAKGGFPHFMLKEILSSQNL
jgi:glucosamine--fructose-6-phosphate aminotransferase (isomerizing)